jgi:hypothetical protein
MYFQKDKFYFVMTETNQAAIICAIYAMATNVNL